MSAEKQQYSCVTVYITTWLIVDILDCYLLHKVAITKRRSRCRQICSQHVNIKEEKNNNKKKFTKKRKTRKKTYLRETFENWKGKTNQNIAFPIYIIYPSPSFNTN